MAEILTRPASLQRHWLQHQWLQHPWRTPLLMSLSLLLCACGSFVRDSAPNTHVDHTRIADAVPKPEPVSKYGNPKSYVVFGKTYRVLESASGYYEEGIASWYGTKFHGARTSSGEPYDMYAMTAAHKTLPIPVYAEVINLQNGRTVVVRINDRGPFVDNRIIDLSYVAAKKLGITDHGIARVSVRVIDPLNPQPAITQANAGKPAADSGVIILPVAKGESVAPTPLDTVPNHTSDNVSVNTSANTTGKVMPIAAAPTVDAAGLVYLQVGAFADHANAAQLAQKLVAASTENVTINRLNNGATNIYRVRIGPLSSDADVQRLRGELQSLGITSPHVVVE